MKKNKLNVGCKKKKGKRGRHRDKIVVTFKDALPPADPDS